MLPASTFYDLLVKLEAAYNLRIRSIITNMEVRRIAKNVTGKFTSYNNYLAENLSPSSTGIGEIFLMENLYDDSNYRIKGQQICSSKSQEEKANRQLFCSSTLY